ncbi:carboxylate-amine ligase [Trichloromonas sp.]|uniref:carboxylate-amine ligase n=1 Tax=Trichloromonas sp. TaxID=3069249 RepID=UPI003D814256
MSEEPRRLHLFEGYGIELEYMIVDAGSLSVLPAADRVLAAQAGELASEVEVGPLRWSNELVLHVIELKTNGPAATLSDLAEPFQAGVNAVNRHLQRFGGRLMPSAMHPWMDPHAETWLWPHENSPIYDSYNRIFGCQGHGWANLQSAHINLPFQGDDEFGPLHAAIRLLLPILPALAASSPMLDGRVSGVLDSRLEVYRNNQKRIPEIAGQVIPEPAFTRTGYFSEILQPMYRAIAPHDPSGILQDEWLNSRGAIARFERDAIEIRVLDVQECPAADLAIATLIAEALKALTSERWQGVEQQMAWAVSPLADLFVETVHRGEQAIITDPAYLAVFGFPGERASAGDLWQHLAQQLFTGEAALPAPLRVIFEHGPLSRRLLRGLGSAPDRARQTEVYRELCDCLAEGRMFLG